MNASLQPEPKLLIVDDHAAIRSVIRTLVGRFTSAVAECENGAEAVETCARFKPDWILMDIQMPGGDGLTATARIMSDFPGTRVVMVTDHDHPSLRAAAQRAGAVAYVRKENLLILEEIIGRGQIPSEARLNQSFNNLWIAIFAQFHFMRLACRAA